MSSLLFSAQKDEGAFLLEWVLYHHLIGLDNIVIYSNDCSDGSDVLLNLLQDEGLLTHYTTTPNADESAQGHAAKHMFSSDHYRQADWVTWVDADEFLNIQHGRGKIDDLIHGLGDAHGTFMNWRLFGDNGLSGWSDGLVLEMQTGCARKGNNENNPVKAFFRPSEAVKDLYIHRPIFGEDFVSLDQTYVDSEGDPIPMEMLTGKRPHGPPIQVHQPRKRRYSLAQVNHYAVRTFDVFSLKKFRGSGMKPVGGSAELRGRRHGDKFWIKRNRNEVQDMSIQRHLPALKQLRQEWLSKPKIRAAHYDCCAALSHRLAELEASGHPMTPDAAGLT